MEVYFLSDVHLDQRAVCKYRKQFNSVEEHNEAIFKCVDVIPSRAILWVMGDWIFKSKKWEDTLNEWKMRTAHIQQLNFVFGNHDELPNNVYFENFNQAHGFFKRWGMWISHSPIHESELFGKRNIHRHVHDNSSAHPLMKPPYSKGAPYFNVNWDFWKRAVSPTEIRDTLGR